MSSEVSVASDAWLTRQLGIPASHLVGTDPTELPVDPSFIDARVPTSDLVVLNRLEDCGFRVIDTAVTLERPDRDVGVGMEPASFAEPGDAEPVGRIAATALTQSRFHLDPLVPDTVACSLKAAWAGSFFSGDRGDWMVVARSAGAVVGFLQLLDRPDALVIDLIATDRAHQGRGMGAAMVSFAAAHCGSAPALRVGTQAANIGSLRFYGSLGFRIVSTDYVLHRHGS